MALFMVVVVAIGWFFSFYYDSAAILYFAIIFSVLMNIWSYWYSDKIALGMYRAKLVENKSDAPDFWNVTENLSITAGLPMPKIYIIADPMPNAFATGRNKEHASIAVTSGLLGMMTKTELEGVISHELSHIGNRDILIATIIVVLVGFVTILSHIFIRASFFGHGGRSREGGGGLGVAIMIIGIILTILSPVVATLIQLAISRKREFLADASGALLTRYPEGLAGALEKISGYSAPMVHANNATAHLFISNPFGTKSLSGMNKWFNTHPPVEERISILRGMK
ncbi:MAG: M48 family metalloprotease [Parcubacteria group bacterium]|nr:M48 family metalloprotease [Parcubacteria group bacterium]